MHFRDHIGTIPAAETRGDIKRVTVMVPDSLHMQIKLHAVRNDITLNDIFIDAVQLYMQSISNSVKMDSKSAD